jgi:tetratricopeptide (TPR) repeat protein
MSGHHIPWFNPREMDDATVLALSTGRGPLLEELLRTITERLAHPAPGRHWLVTGTRGAGKSYFLRLAQSHAHQRWRSGEMRLVLLPEELPNVFSPHQFLDEISRMVRRDRGSADVGQVAAWRVPDPAQAWKHSLAALLTSFDEPLLVVGIENYTELLRQVFTDEASAALLRKLMAEEPRLMLLATAVDGSVDEDYSQILFRQFEHHALPAWDEKLHRAYLGSRARLIGKVATRRQLARIDAYSRYTGGNARIAGVLAGAILEENDFLDTGADLNAALDKMSDYYREQLGRMPPKTRGLFDALVRGGDPCSQTQLADRVGARQNEISRPFGWMVDAGYLHAERDKGERETRYRVADRLFVQWYRMRYLEPGQRARLAVMAELLADMVEFEEKWHYALRLHERGETDEAEVMVDLALKDRGIQIGSLMKQGLGLNELVQMGQRWVLREEKSQPNTEGSHLEKIIEFLEIFPDESSMVQAMTDGYSLLAALDKFPASENGHKLSELLSNSLSLSPVEKIRVMACAIHPRFLKFQWDELINIFNDEIIEFKQAEEHEIEAITKLREKCMTGRRSLPITISWNDLIHNEPAVEESYGALGKNILLASCQTVALAGWHKSGKSEQASSTIKEITKKIDKFINIMPKAAQAILTKISASIDSGEANASAHHHAEILIWKAISEIEMSQINIALQSLEKSISLSSHAEKNNIGKITAWAYEKTGWCLGILGKIDQAIEFHEHAEKMQQSFEVHGGNAWNIGQQMRYSALKHGISSAWELRNKIPADWPEKRKDWCLRQLGDAVADTQRQQGPSAAFALGRQILQHFADDSSLSFESLLRGYFIDMIDMDVTPGVLHDLLAEVPELAGEQRMTNLAPLLEVLGAWITDLTRTADERASARKKMDPDLATTLDALTHELPLKTRIRLGLAESPELSPEAEALFNRILRQIGRAAGRNPPPMPSTSTEPPLNNQP